MNQHNIRVTLQIAAVLSILIGVCMGSTAVVAWVATKITLSDMPRSASMQLSGIARLGFIGALAAFLPALWGFLLYRFAPKLAVKIDAQTDAVSARIPQEKIELSDRLKSASKLNG